MLNTPIKTLGVYSTAYDVLRWNDADYNVPDAMRIFCIHLNEFDGIGYAVLNGKQVLVFDKCNEDVIGTYDSIDAFKDELFEAFREDTPEDE